MGKIFFQEKQRFNQWIIWLLVLSIASLSIYRFFESNGGMEFLVPFIIIGLVILLFLSLQLRTKIDEVGIHVQMFPIHLKPVLYNWEKLKSVEVVEYSPIKEYGGWGVRISGNGKAFNVKGNKGIKLQTINGKTRMIGTQKMEEAKTSIDQWFNPAES
jgi:hypothetical protein